MASVHILVSSWRGEEDYDLEDREFDALPRVGDSIMFSQGFDVRKPQINELAEVRVTKVVHDLRVGYHSSVHVFVYVEPIGDALRVLELLYPPEEFDEN